MNTYSIIFSRKATKAFDALMSTHRSLGVSIAAAIDELRQHPYLGIPLIGKLKGFYKLRIGTYRIIYAIQQRELIVYIIDLGHRRDIYR